MILSCIDPRFQPVVYNYLKKKNPKIQIGLSDPYGSALYNYFKINEMKSEGNSITEGIGQGRITKNLEKKKIVVFYEQGIGDTLQFSKYVYCLTKTAKEVVFVVNNTIKDLFRSDLKNLKIETRDSFIKKEFDYKISLGSLIKFFYLEKFSSHDYLINKNIDLNTK